MKRYITPLLLSLLVTACATSEQKAMELAETDTQLASYYWQLNDAKDASGNTITSLFVQKQKPIQIEFSEGRFSVKNLCNALSGLYTVTETTISFGQAASTKMLCGDPKIDALDNEMGKRILNSSAYQLSPPTDEKPALLQLKTSNNEDLTFVGIPTPDTRYRSQGETIFLEIAPQFAPSDTSAKPVPQVRQVYYNTQGIRTAADPWQPLTQTIEGLTIEEGIHQVVRVKRYNMTNDQTASKAVYVMDQIIEAQVIQPKKLTKRPETEEEAVKTKRLKKKK